MHYFINTKGTCQGLSSAAMLRIALLLPFDSRRYIFTTLHAYILFNEGSLLKNEKVWHK